MSGDYFCPAYGLSPASRDAVAAWVAAQTWPPATRLKQPSKYHVTCLYSPTGFRQERNHRWLEAQPQRVFTARCIAVEMFGSGRGRRPRPVALRLESPELRAHAQALMDAAETELGLPVSRFAGGYRAHLTVAFASRAVELPAPDLALELGPLYEHHTLIRKLDAAPRPAR